MSRPTRCRSCVWLGLFLSAALHAAIAAALLRAAPPPATVSQERVVALDLALFGDQGGENAGSLIAALEASAPHETPAVEPPTPAPGTSGDPADAEVAKPESAQVVEEPPPTAPSVSAPGPSLAALTRATAKRPPDARKTAERKASRGAPQKPKPAPKVVQQAKPKPQPKSKARALSQPPSGAAARTARAKTNGSPGKTGKTSGGTRANPGLGASSQARSSPAKAASERDYLNALQRAIAKHQRYPTNARSDHQTGVATLAFVIQADGRIGQIRVASSSGHTALDQAALQAMYRLGRFKPIPETLGRRSWPLRVPIRFDLR